MRNRELCVHRMNVVLCEANCKRLVLTGFVADFLYLLTKAQSCVLEKASSRRASRHNRPGG